MDRLSDCQQFPQERDWEYHAHRSRDGRIIKGSFNVLLLFLPCIAKYTHTDISRFIIPRFLVKWTELLYTKVLLIFLAL